MKASVSCGRRVAERQSRLLAATAMHDNLPLVSADVVFDGVVSRVW